jgi:hypothetical protein
MKYTLLLLLTCGVLHAQRIALPDGVVLTFDSLSVGKKIEKPAGSTEYLPIKYQHSPLPTPPAGGPAQISLDETRRSSPVQIRLRYAKKGEGLLDVYLVDGKGMESKARVYGRPDHPERPQEAADEGWLCIDAYLSRQDFYHLRFRAHSEEYDPYDIPSLALAGDWRIKNTAKVESKPEKGSLAPLAVTQGQVTLVMKSFIRRRQPREDAAERTSAEFEVKHPFKADLPYEASTDSMTMWDQSGNQIHFGSPACSFGNSIKLWARDTFMSDDDCYGVRVDIWRRPTVPELFKEEELFHFNHIPVPGKEDNDQAGITVTHGDRKLTLRSMTSAAGGRPALVLTGSLPAHGEQFVLVDAVDDHGRHLAGVNAPAGCRICEDSVPHWDPPAIPAKEMMFRLELPKDVAWINADFTFDKALSFEFKVTPELVD